jgi:hypothetical protein
MSSKEDSKNSPNYIGEAYTIRCNNPPEDYRPPMIQERLDKQLCQSKEQAKRMALLEELSALLKENPVVARILELLEATHLTNL